MKTFRGLFVVMLSSCAVLALLAVLQPVRSATAVHAAVPLDVVINEVAWGGTAADSDHEWIELRNNTTATIDLAGWRLYGSGGTTPPNITLSGTIPVSGYFLLERVTDLAVSDIPADQIYPNEILNNTSGILTLTDSLSNVIDTAN